MARKDIFGTEIEVGDIVFSAPQNSGYNGASIGIVHSVGEGDRWTPGRVMIRVPQWRSIYAYEIPGAPLVPGFKWGYLKGENGNDIWEEDRWGGKRKKFDKYPAMVKNDAKVGEDWRWCIIQGAWYTMVVLRKKDTTGDIKSLDELFGMTKMAELLNLDYSTPKPKMPKPEGK